jgi:anion-transporting  ArsA/GET3 family ATPase
LLIARCFLYVAPVSAARLLFVTGKGGVGKTTVAAALGWRVAARGGRALLVELAADRGLARLFATAPLGGTPRRVAKNLDAVRLEPRPLLEAYFTRLLRLPFLSRRLFSSITFNAVTTAAPGVSEFLILESLLGWLEPGRLRRRAYDTVVLDGPATGHALALLRSPAKLLRMVTRGPLGNTSRRLVELFADHERAAVVLVAIADDMAINEVTEAHRAVDGELAMRVAPPVLNLAADRRFSSEDARAVDRLSAEHADDPVLAAARLQIAARRETERHLGRLRAAFGTAPVSLPLISDEAPQSAHLDDLGARLERVLEPKNEL